jgi:phage baseplate assembly protein V
MERVINALKVHATALVQSVAQPRFATVSSVDPSSGTVKVALQPEGVLTGWLPLLSPWAGSGWGVVCLPEPGDQVLVLAQEGHSEHGIVIGRIFSSQQKPPNAPTGELWIVHSSGSFIKLQNDGTIRVGGDLHVAGDVFDAEGSLSRLRGRYDAHTHEIPQGGTTSFTSETD